MTTGLDRVGRIALRRIKKLGRILLNAIQIVELSWHAKPEFDELRRLLIGMLAPEAGG